MGGELSEGGELGECANGELGAGTDWELGAGADGELSAGEVLGTDEELNAGTDGGLGAGADGELGAGADGELGADAELGADREPVSDVTISGDMVLALCLELVINSGQALNSDFKEEIKSGMLVMPIISLRSFYKILFPKKSYVIAPY